MSNNPRHIHVKTVEVNLGSEDFMCGWFACATKGALRPGVLLNAFSS